ncbi:MAG TPA: MliC family protein [Nevskiaceae bacterium]|nr:MliC family protein [Nevskiaceae bacterium]
MRTSAVLPVLGLGLAGCAGLALHPAPERYRCAGESLIELHPRGEDRELVWEGHRFTLRPVPAASGLRYEGEGLSWHEKGSQGLLSKNGETVLAECQRQPPVPPLPRVTGFPQVRP